MINFDLTPAQYRAEYFEKKPRLFKGALTERPYTWSDIDELLLVLEPRLPVVRLFRNGQLPESHYTEDATEAGRTRRVFKKAKFYELMSKGATLTINWLELYSVAAKRLCLEIGRYAATRTSSNAYLSFCGDGTFGAHWDTHDVFVVQLIGCKQWKVFEPTWPLPLSQQTNERSGQQCPTKPALEFVLEAGDVVYVPRGWWHHVIPMQAGSFHLSIGSYAPTLFDYVVQTSAKWLERQVEVRRAFSAADYEQTVTEMLQKLQAVLLDPINVAGFELDWLSRERMTAEFDLASLDATASASIAGTASLSLTTYHAPTLAGGLLLVNGEKLQLDPASQAIITVLRDQQALSFDALCERLGDMPRDAVQRAVLDLTRHDVVTVHARAAPGVNGG
jgi:ribosomal protein L16 Arg81 hydroxylase